MEWEGSGSKRSWRNSGTVNGTCLEGMRKTNASIHIINSENHAELQNLLWVVFSTDLDQRFKDGHNSSCL
jgi:hypothetical protein